MLHEDIKKTAQLMADFDRPWAFGGGWAIDLWLGRQTRTHKDVDLIVWRDDQRAAYDYLVARGWTLQQAIDGTLIPWDGSWIALPVHTIWCRHAKHTPDFIELLFNEHNDSDFLFRRDQTIKRALNRAFVNVGSGLRVLAPEIVLLYKARDKERSGHAADFINALPKLQPEQCRWLHNALNQLHDNHEWTKLLK